MPWLAILIIFIFLVILPRCEGMSNYGGPSHWVTNRALYKYKVNGN